GTPAFAAQLPLAVLFSPLFVLQGVGVILSASKFVEKLVLLLRSGAGGGLYFRFSSRAHDCLGFLHHGSR
ncbi:transmembrane fragile-X-F-associated protein, partial [Trifolium medium]|nr:transmembrane fragile-X-F-associated protein [Trifolium medium]